MLNLIDMQIYIEKQILDRLNTDFLCENLSLGQVKLRDLLQSFSELELFTNAPFENIEFENYKFENPLFNKIIEKTILISTISFDDFMSKCNFKQTIAIESKENLRNKDLIESKGGLYFTYDNYSKNIVDIITHYHKRIDLSDTFIGWTKIFSKTILKLNEIIINDNYLVDKTEYIDIHIKPLINSVKKQCKLDRIVFFTDFNKKLSWNKELIESQLKNTFDTLIKIHHNKIKRPSFSYHDRILYTNFLLIDCPIGFENIRISNSVITIETVFDKFTYDRRRRHNREIEKLTT